jgi:hypothetical protein
MVHYEMNAEYILKVKVNVGSVSRLHPERKLRSTFHVTGAALARS